MPDDDRDFIERANSVAEKLHGEPMTTEEIANNFALFGLQKRAAALEKFNTDLRGGRYESDPTLNQNMAKAALDAVAADVDELQARPPAPPAEVDVPALVAALTPAIRQIVREEIDDTKLGQMP